MVQGVTPLDFSYYAGMNEYDQYDEFAHFDENRREWGLADVPARARRAFVAVEGLRQVSALVWGEGPPELVLVHGSAQNAHTFDTVALALDRPVLALDLPHHGHSDASFFGPRAPREHARDLAVALEELANVGLPVAAMSYGGLVSIVLAHDYPSLVTRLILIDITPGVSVERARPIREFVEGPEEFASFEEILERTRRYNPERSDASLRRGVLHNALARPDGTWVWRHQRHAPATRTPQPVPDLWDWLEEITVPVSLVRALGPSSVVSDLDVDEFRRRRPLDEVIEVPGASHSVQGSHPLELADIITQRL